MVAFFLDGHGDFPSHSLPISFGATNTKDPLRTVCLELLRYSDIRVLGSARVAHCVINQAPFALELYHHDFLAACWYREHGNSIGDYLMLLSYPDMRRIFDAQGSLMTEAVERFVKAADPWLSSGDSLHDVLASIRESKPLVTEADYTRVAERLSELRQGVRKGKIEYDRRQELEPYGAEGMCRDLGELVGKYGSKVPAGYLVHASDLGVLDNLPVGERLFTLLSSWRRATRWPSTRGCLQQDGRFPVLESLVGSRQSEVMEWLKSQDSDEAVKILQKLTKMASKAKSDLARGFPGTGFSGRIWSARREWMAKLVADQTQEESGLE